MRKLDPKDQALISPRTIVFALMRQMEWWNNGILGMKNGSYLDFKL
jgi:hypothetical protein